MTKSETLIQATTALESGDLAKAQELYSSLLSVDWQSGSAHYNLGIAYFRDNQLGSAIYHFRKAHQLLPRDADVAFNLDYARRQAKDEIESSTSSVASAFEKNYPLNLKESGYAFAGSIVAFTLLLTLSLFRKSEGLRWLRYAALLLATIFAGGSAFRMVHEKPFGVIAQENTRVYSGKGQETVLLFSLNEGTEFELKRQDDEWVRIRLADGKSGWIPKTNAVFSR